MDPIKDGRNWYNYCANNPLKFVDPNGKLISLTAIGIGFLAVAAVGAVLAVVADMPEMDVNVDVPDIDWQGTLDKVRGVEDLNTPSTICASDLYNQKGQDTDENGKIVNPGEGSGTADPGMNGDDNNNNNNNNQRMTNREADAEAERLGFKKTNYKSHGQRVYKKGNRYITRDVDGHSGGSWKMADSVENLGRKSTRMGTYDADLNWIAD